MRESIRVRLLVWHWVTVTAMIATLGATVTFSVWRTRVRELDVRLRQRAEVLIAAVKPAGDDTFDVALPTSAAPGSSHIYHALWTPRGALLDRSDAASSASRPGSPGVQVIDGRREFIAVTPSGLTVLTGQDMADVRREIGTLAWSLVASGGVVLALSLAGGWILAGRTLRPLSAINATAKRMARGDLSARVPTDRLETELDEVGRALNAAFDRLQAAIDRQRQFTADASHELRTPLATLSAEIQWALTRPRTADAYRAALEVSLRAATRIQAVVTRLLVLARAQTPGAAPRDRVALDDVVSSVIADLQPLARDRGVDVATRLTPAVVLGDAAGLTEAVTNVVGNAIRYNTAGGRVSVDVMSDDGVTIRIEDTGIGMAPEDARRAFDPFFRADPARAHDEGGTGLGLALTKAIVEGCGGRVTCRSELGRGTVMELWLPGRSAPDGAGYFLS